VKPVRALNPLNLIKHNTLIRRLNRLKPGGIILRSAVLPSIGMHMIFQRLNSIEHKAKIGWFCFTTEIQELA
jgi:hypothetical protein